MKWSHLARGGMEGMMEKEMERQSRCCLGENGQGEQADMQDLGVEPLAFILAAPRAPMSDGINLTCSPSLGSRLWAC